VLCVAASAACGDARTPVHPAGAARDVAALSVPAGAPVASGPEMDYQSSLLRVKPAGTLMMAIERLDPATRSGDLYVASSLDGGATWTAPQPGVATAMNERHPALVQLASGGFALFYLGDEGGGAYRIHRATSPDGVAWTRHGAVELGWRRPGEINPAVIVEDDGTLTMTYHRSGGRAYIARSADGGATWDTRRTAVTRTAAMLPRVARRAGDGRYLVTYQVSGAAGAIQIFAETSTDPYAWGGPAVQVSPNTNDHDAQPIVLEDGTFLLAYAQSVGGTQYDLVYRRSPDGAAWGPAVQLTDDPDLADVQPHPVLHGTPGRVVMAWTRQKTAGGSDHDIWVNPDLAVQ
ncbi:MAG: exo-alpha-sialidase, partial [Gemmatimonadota bacterium]